MKKVLLAVLIGIIVSTLLMGCSSEEGNDEGSLLDKLKDFKKTQKIEVISSDDAEKMTTMTSNKEIEKFVEALKMDDWDWDPVELPAEAIQDKTFKIYRKDAAKFSWLKKKENRFNEVATMTTYKDAPYIRLNMKVFGFNFEVPEEAYEYLSSMEIE